MKKRYKLLSLIEISVLVCFLFSTKVFLKKVKCDDVECKVVDDNDGIVNTGAFQDIFDSLRGEKMVNIDLVNLRNEIKKFKVVDEVKILKRKDKIGVEIRPHKILGVAYFNYSDGEEKRDPEFILDDGEKIFLKLKNEKNFIPVICDNDEVKIIDILPILNFINNDSKVKSLINTISLKKGNFYVTTILNDSFVNLGSFFDTKSVICRICDMHKIIYFSNDFPCIELSDNVLFLQKKRI